MPSSSSLAEEMQINRVVGDDTLTSATCMVWGVLQARLVSSNGPKIHTYRMLTVKQSQNLGFLDAGPYKGKSRKPCMFFLPVSCRRLKHVTTPSMIAFKVSRTATSLTSLPAHFWCLLPSLLSSSAFVQCPNKGFVRANEILLLLLWNNTVSEQTGVLLQNKTC